MSTRQLIETFKKWQAARMPLVLVTVVGTEGSTYTKPGHRMLIAASGEYQGLVSGGCLEGDLAEHARAVLASGAPKLVTYDLRGDNDALWGLGIGCNGLFHLLLQPLSPDTDYQPFSSIAYHLAGFKPSIAATVVDSTDEAVIPAATVVVGPNTTSAWMVAGEWQARLIEECRRRMDATGAGIASEMEDGRELRVLYAPLRPVPNLLVLGAGRDAVPLVETARRLGWNVTVNDHRPAFLARGDLDAADEIRCTPAAQALQGLNARAFTAAVVMSHHLESDREYLRALAHWKIPYIGLLGPPARRDRLLAELGADAESLRPRLHAPAGLNIGADSPESIALAILAEIHAVIAGRAAAAGMLR